jgi:glycosyltransferase involved in cell wall biosynthesis
MNPELSIILPSIRPKLLKGVYDSILKSTNKNFELIIVSPYPLPEDLLEYKNIKYVRDFGSPVRAHNIALLLCEADIITWTADDCIMLENSIDEHLDLLSDMGEDRKNVVVAKYFEGQKGSKERDSLQTDQYFKICNTPASSPFLPHEWWLFNVGYMYRKFAYALGGWDCEYEGTWVAHTDMAIRAQEAGATVKMAPTPQCKVDHMPGKTGDHGPIYECQTFHDEPAIQKKYRNAHWRKDIILRKKIMNWKDAQTVWDRRFS